MATAASKITPLRRIVTGHDAQGKAIVNMDSATPNQKTRSASGLVSALVWATDESPANISLSTDRADRSTGVAPPDRGTIFRIVDFPPTGEGIDQRAVMREMGLSEHQAARHPMMHRTRSVDYVIVMSGSIDMLLDDTEVHMNTGDVMVQQGTNHAWVNRGSEVCRIAFVLVDAVAPAGIDYGH